MSDPTPVDEFAGVPEPQTDDDIARDVLPLALSIPPVD